MSTPIWHKGARAEDWVTRFTVGDDHEWDTLLLPYDLTASEAHAWGLTRIGVLDSGEFEALQTELARLRERHEAGDLVVTVEDEDCHTVIEHALTEALGDAGRKIHTGRSRNDQVLAALRLFLRDALDDCGRAAVGLADALCGVGERAAGIPLPGYTHFQRAMPSSASLWATGYAELLAEDIGTLGEARTRMNVSPLGSAAGFGVPYLALPREAVAERLGFRAVQLHVTAVQLSRGKLEMGVVHGLVQLAASLNRLASDIVLYASSEFGFIRLPAEVCTGSSIMPQKKNPDVAELARATFHRILSDMQLLATLPANLPSGYHRDLQLTKASVMRATLTTRDLLSAMLALVPGMSFDRDRVEAVQDPALFATAAAMRAVKDGTPFRDAYRGVAGEPEQWEVERRRAVGELYGRDGDPGRERPDVIRGRIRSAGSWIP